VKFLSGAAEDGEGSAAQPLTRRPDRLLSRRTSNLLMVSVAAAAIGLVAAKLVFPTSGAGASGDAPLVATSPVVTPSPSPSATGRSGGQRMEYAIALADLRGLPLDLREGSEIDLWVSWDDDYAEGPQVRKLLRTVSISRFVQPVTADGPLVVVLSIPNQSLKAVMYGDLYGSFAVAVPTSS
jgi:hypothetical protein